MGIGTVVRFFRTVADWWDDFGRIEDIAHSEFIKTYITPTIVALVSVFSGIYAQPVMWIIMAASVTFAAILQAVANAANLRDKWTPQNKLTFQIAFQQDLNRVQAPLLGNRQQRRSASPQSTYLLGAHQVHASVKRNIEKAQIGIEITNNSGFPISCILMSAITDIEGAIPPRSEFPKPAATVLPWSKMRIMDDAIDADSLPCQRLTGNVNMLVKYGRPGSERYELGVKGSIDIGMEESGFISFITMSLTDEPLPSRLTLADLRK